jgi:hypothetical protein
MSPRKRHHIRQGRPNRRFRRLVPAAVATAALAAGMPAVSTAATHHDSKPPTAQVGPAGPQKAVAATSKRDAAGGGAVPAG